jgi:hypothetical protein
MVAVSLVALFNNRTLNRDPFFPVRGPNIKIYFTKENFKMSPVFKKLIRHLFLAIVCLTMFGLTSTAHAQSWSTRDVQTFLENSLPAVRGTVVDQRERNVFVELEQAEGPERVPVEIVRRVVSVEGGSRSLNERKIGQGTLRRREDSLAILLVSDRVRQRIQVGDRVQNTGFRIFVRYQTNSWSDQWQSSLNELSGIDSIQAGSPADPTDQTLVLTVSADRLTLKKAGEWGTLAQTTRSEATREPRSRQRDTTQPYLREIDEIDRVLHDFNIVPLPDYQRVQLAVLGGRNAVGFARWKNEVTSLSWHDVTGEILRVIPLADRMDGLDSFPFLLVKKNEETIFTQYFEYDLTRREMNRQWSYEDVWIDRVRDQFYAWQIGLNEAFKDRGYPVTVKDNTWDWIDNAPTLPRQTIPSAVDRIERTIYRVNKENKLDVFRHGENVFSSSRDFGGHPVSISGRRSRITIKRHPSILAWNTSEGRNRVLVANNRTEGVPYFENLQTYHESHLYLLLGQSDYLDTLWESDRLSGYVTGIYSGPETPWVITVHPENKTSRIQQLMNVNYRSSSDS